MVRDNRLRLTHSSAKNARKNLAIFYSYPVNTLPYVKIAIEKLQMITRKSALHAKGKLSNLSMFFKIDF